MKKRVTILLCPLLAFIIYMTMSSSSGGISGVSSSGCSCHSVPTASTVVTLTGLPSGGYINGTTYPVTVSVTNASIVSAAPFGKRDGFDLSASSGNFVAIPGTTVFPVTEIYHNTPKAPVGNTATWTFNWVAPASGSATVTFNLSGNATNGNGNTSGDFYNSFSTTLAKAATPLAVTTTNSTILCNNGTSTITATGSGGTSPYTYRLNAGTFQTSNIFTSNLANIYTVTVRDATLATATTIVSISQPSPITLSASGTILCNGGTATITANASGGTGAFTYRLNGGTFQTSPSFINNLAGTYLVTARDANVCTKTTSFVLSAPALLSFSAPTITQPICNGGMGSATINASGGTGTKTYTISPSGPQSNTTGIFNNLIAQSYTVTVTDANNCTKTSSFTMGEPSPLVVTANNVSGCSGSNIALSGLPSGGVFSVPNPYNGPSTTYTYTYTDGNGCVGVSSPASITVTPCGTNLNLILYLQGYYTSAGFMNAVLFNQGSTVNSSVVDSINVELHDTISPFSIVESIQTVLNTDGTAACSFTSPPGFYYVAIRHRNTLLTWSATPISLSSIASTYNFSTSASQAYGDNQTEIETGIWALYSGDLIVDENIDLLDLSSVENDVNNFVFGYFPTDINGDGNVDLLDTPVVESNLNNFIFSSHP